MTRLLPLLLLCACAGSLVDHNDPALTGNVTASERVEIRATGSVTGDIASPNLAIVEGGCLQGKVEMPQPRSSQPARPMA